MKKKWVIADLSQTIISSNKSVKEQRVDGSCFGYNSKLRYTLMGFERNYRIKNPSKQINKLSYSTLNFQNKLNRSSLFGFLGLEK